MNIFIGNLPASMSAHQLRRLFRTVLSRRRWWWPFSSRVAVERMTIRVIEQISHEGVRRYGYAEIEPPGAAQLCIERLNGLEINGQCLAVREFYRRNYLNERRAVNWRDKPWQGRERRQLERRNQLGPDPAS